MQLLWCIHDICVVMVKVLNDGFNTGAICVVSQVNVCVTQIVSKPHEFLARVITYAIQILIFILNVFPVSSIRLNLTFSITIRLFFTLLLLLHHKCVKMQVNKFDLCTVKSYVLKESNVDYMQIPQWIHIHAIIH